MPRNPEFFRAVRWYNGPMDIAAEWHTAWHDISRLIFAYIIALPVGWYREREAHSIGVRTFPLVAMASCGYVLLGMQKDGGGMEAQSRIIHPGRGAFNTEPGCAGGDVAGQKTPRPAVRQ